jgi:paraquat-inducible protein A
MKKLILILLLVSIAALMLSGFKAWEQAAAYEKETKNVIQYLDADSRLESTGQRLLEWLSLGTYSGYSDELQQIIKHKNLQQAYGKSAWLLTGIFFLLALPVVVLAFMLRSDWCDMAYAMLGVSIVALVIGLITPILSVSAQQDLPVIGETVLQFQSKGIVSTILGLKNAGSVWLALLLAFFSVFIPMAKTSLAAVTIFARSHKLTLKGLSWSKSIGKWSMADVFVVAVLVVFFSNGQDGLTQAEVQIGLCFFAGYVVLSLISTSIINHQLNIGTGEA